jgi:hypothetical protein
MQHLHPVYLLTHVLPLLVLLALVLRAFGIKSFGQVLFAPFWLLRFLLVIALLGLAGCSHTEKLAEAKGPLFPLNPDHWQVAPADLKDPPEIGK